VSYILGLVAAFALFAGAILAAVARGIKPRLPW